MALRRTRITRPADCSAHLLRHRSQPDAAVFPPVQPRKNEFGPRHVERRKRRGKDKRPHPVDQIIVHQTAAHYVCPNRSQRLAERAAQEINVRQTALLFGYAQPVPAPHTNGVCLIDVKHHIRISLLQLRQCGKRSHIAIHAEHAFGHDDKPIESGMMFLHQALQLPVILMAVADAPRRRQANAVYQAGVHQLVGKYQRMPIRHSGQDAHVQVITAAERQGTFTPEPSGKQHFQFAVHRKIARQQTGRGSRKQAVSLRHTAETLLLQASVGSQPQIIVRRNVQHPPSVLPNPYPVVFRFGQGAQVAFPRQCV